MAAQNLTYLQIVNVVLPRLRRATVAAVNTNPYSLLIGQIVNEVKSEIEDAWHWYAMRDTYTITTVPGTSSYTFTGVGRGAVIKSAFNTSLPKRMKLGSNFIFDQRFFEVTTVATGSPEEYIPSGFDASYDLTIDVWPVPSSTQSLKFNLYVPQDDLSADSDVPLVPINVLLAGVLARALAERGDDNGQSAEKQDMVYRNLLGSAIAVEEGREPSEMDWEAV